MFIQVEATGIINLPITLKINQELFLLNASLDEENAYIYLEELIRQGNIIVANGLEIFVRGIKCKFEALDNNSFQLVPTDDYSTRIQSLRNEQQNQSI
jgi:hypothetical protein